MAKIFAYLSHSYHPEDRAINMAIWRKLNALDVAFVVDPPSPDRPMDVTFLERMMRRSDCFVAIVPDRSRASDAPPASPTWSPYQEFECRLAIRANKPRLIVVEDGIELGPLSEGQSTRWFRRAPLELDPELDKDIQQFVDEAMTRESKSGTMPKMGILRWTPADARWERLTGALRRRVGKEVADFVEVSDETRDHDLLNDARKLTVLVADINPAITPPHVLGLLHGAAIPIFRTCAVESDQDDEKLERALRLRVDDAEGPGTDDGEAGLPAPSVRLPLLFRGYRVDRGMRPIQFWREDDTDKAVEAIARLTKEYRDRERRLETQENADDYFLKLRGNRIFISTSSELSAWTTPLKEALQTAGMPAFHYKVPDIEIGAEWMPELRQRIADADLFLAFLSPGYWASPVCLDEMALAIERWERHQLIIIVGTPAARPPMPVFLSRYQTEALSNADRDIDVIVSHVQSRFRREGRSDVLSIESIGTPLARHLEAEGITNTGIVAFLQRECGVPAADAADVAARAGGDAFKLVETLINRARVEKLGGSALGRLCFWLRRREVDPATRRALTRQFSLLRLFPKLHDLRSWNERRNRRDIPITIAPTAPRPELEVITALAGDHAQALDTVRQMSTRIAGYLEVAAADLTALATQDRCRVSVVSTVDDLMIPVEWAVVAGISGPLARACPVSRRIALTEPRRESIEDQFEDAAAAPPRVLLFGYGPPELLHVHTEIAALHGQFTRRYAANEWPVDLIDLVSGPQATAEVLRLAISDSDIDILHLAGHAGWVDGGPALQLAGAGGKPSFVASGDLGQWLKRSSVRFVYLSCCGGASTPLGTEQFAGWRQTLCRDVIEAGVAEVAGYFWPVSDQRSSRFASQFYESFLQDFDAPAAMLSARRATMADDPVWAGSIIVKTTRPKGQS